MTIILILVILALCGVVFYQFFYWRRLLNASREMLHEALLANVDLEEKGREKDENYRALDEGNQEIVDNYENDLLDMKTRMEASYNAAAYDRQMRDEVEKKLEQANLIIEKHSDKCDSLVEDIADMLIAEVLPREE